MNKERKHSLQKFAACCNVVRGVWSSGDATSVSWWARALAPRIVARAAAAARPTDSHHARAAVQAVAALDELIAATPQDAREL